LECVEFNQDGSYEETYFTYLPRSAYNFSNLHLAVIGTCRHLSSTLQGDDFPFLQHIVGGETGTKCGIGVMGRAQRPTLPNGQRKEFKDWYFIYTKTYQEWADLFWLFAAKGKEDEKELSKKYPTIRVAAEMARDIANEKLKDFSRKWNDDFEVYVRFFGEDDYLGHIDH